MTSSRPTRITGIWSSSAARIAPSTSLLGALSPPIASTAIVNMDALAGYSSATSITSRPLYFPQCGQTRCGSLGSWQLGHCANGVRRRESCVRRAEVRRLECRRLGFGIFSYLLERCPAVVTRIGLAAALLLVAILPAHRTDPFAILVTQLLHGERQ